MPRYRLLYHREVVERDLPRLDHSIRRRIRAAIEWKLIDQPENFAKPLAHTTQRLWALRVGDWRVIFTLRTEELWILKIGHRRDVYASRTYPEPTGEYSVSEPNPLVSLRPAARRKTSRRDSPFLSADTRLPARSPQGYHRSHCLGRPAYRVVCLTTLGKQRHPR